MSLRRYFLKAQKQGWAIGAFNAANVEVVKAILGAAEKLKTPVIIESSPRETAYIQPENLVDLVNNTAQEKKVTAFVNLDHGRDLASIKAAVMAGYDMVHFDGSSLTFKENIRKTREVIRFVGRKRILVEGEIDRVVGSSQVYNQPAREVQLQGVYTDPEKAREFVKKTRIDILAAFVGNLHGLYKTTPKLDIERLLAIKKSAGCFLSLHGGSGIEPGEVKRAIRAGVVKVNVNTELRQAYKQALAISLRSRTKLAVYDLMPSVIKAVQQVVERKIRIFGSVGKGKR